MAVGYEGELQLSQFEIMGTEYRWQDNNHDRDDFDGDGDDDGGDDFDDDDYADDLDVDDDGGGDNDNVTRELNYTRGDSAGGEFLLKNNSSPNIYFIFSFAEKQRDEQMFFLQRYISSLCAFALITLEKLYALLVIGDYTLQYPTYTNQPSIYQ